MSVPAPCEIKLHTKTRCVELVYKETSYQLSYEFLRVHSPSAEARGHGNPVLQTGKKQIRIRDMETVGHYALKIHFDDGHDTGLYSWPYLLELCQNQETLWQQYLADLKAAGASREPIMIGSWSQNS